LNKDLLDRLLCPACGGQLELGSAAWETIEYESGPSEEVRSGSVGCACGREYPVEDFVLSFASLFPPELAREGSYWDRYYGWLLEHGSLGFHDLRLGQAPYITMGVPEPFPLASTLDRYTVHHEVASHPLLRRGERLLDIGVGLGWTSLYFAREGYSVTAFEPSAGPIRAAKRYAISQGVPIEYICAALGHIRFVPGSFDNVTAFHSLHHVPNLDGELSEVKRWLVPGGALAIDEHVGNSKLAASLGAQVHAWAEEEVFPRYRTLSPEALATLPSEPHSEMEDTSVDEVAPLVSRLFRVHLSRPRHVFLDHYPLLHYLATDRDEEAYRHSLPIANHLQELVRRADPEGGDYLTIIAENAEVELQEEPAFTSQVEDLPTPQIEEPLQIRAHAPDAIRDPQSEIRKLETEALQEELRKQGEWAAGLERELKRKSEQVERLEGHVRRLESGRVMRLLRRLGRKK
jgi:2-polyprenyl-3-methyl-5-hydroxy-6-metoxy-1,4-benzoquinol methylase/uncharacterized protein YbaR (Trm112 family)